MDLQKYLAIVAEFDLLLAYAQLADKAFVGKKSACKRQSYAAEVFCKLLAHCITLREISPDLTTPGKRQLWDLGSASAIARCVIESYDSFAYIAALSATVEEREFRLLLWGLHDYNRRIKMLQ